MMLLQQIVIIPLFKVSQINFEHFAGLNHELNWLSLSIYDSQAPERLYLVSGVAHVFRLWLLRVASIGASRDVTIHRLSFKFD